MAIAGRRYANVPVVVRGTLADPPVLTTPAPVVIAAPADRRWYASGRVTVLGGPKAPVVAAAAATPGPVVVTSRPPWPGTARAIIVRGTLQDAPVLTSAAPVVVAAPPDRRWFAARPPLALKGGAAPPPATGNRGLLMAGIV